MDIQQQIDEINKKLDAFLNEYYRNSNPSSETFTKKVYFKGGVDLSGDSISFGTSSGSIGMYGVTPVTKAAAIPAPSGAGPTYDPTEANSTVTSVNAIRTALRNIGITA